VTSSPGIANGEKAYLRSVVRDKQHGPIAVGK